VCVCVCGSKEELTQKIKKKQKEQNRKKQLKKRKQILNENCNRCGCAKSHWETVGNEKNCAGGCGKMERRERKTVGNLQAHMYRACGFWIADWVAVGA